MLFLSVIPVRVGFNCGRLSHLFNCRVPYLNQQHMVDLNLYLVTTLGLVPNRNPPRFNFSEADQNSVHHLLLEEGIQPEDNFVIIHPGTHTAPRWPIERFAKLAETLIERYQIRIICVGTLPEKPLAKQIQNLMQINSLIDLTGKTTVTQLAYLISLGSVFIGHSSGPLHLSFLMGTPSVSLWGVSRPQNWGPYWEKHKHICLEADLDCLGCNQYECPKGTLECMTSISVPMVINAVEQLLKRTSVRRERTLKLS